MPADYVKLAQTYLSAYPERQQSYFAALTRFSGESTQTISSNWLKSEYLRHKLSQGSYSRIDRATAKVSTPGWANQ